MRTSELTGAALEWAVAVAIGDYKPVAVPHYSTSWAQGGSIIEREKIKLGWVVDHWEAQKDFNYNKCFTGRDSQHPLVAAMRCYVASKLGETVDIPKELL